ncbi:hypothetical protein FB567DRAFT_533568 [Paraphoma chrysanthemicola]|uniref:Secreted protein n=1 Tax=Paraphoma chrysanthemicola TaxID=798071 RepID=A0A8K0VUD1_9PLEO|nr:hypothetical protein FB567DRAFT_533568 [Paraphoma chrysanthemicola]
MIILVASLLGTCCFHIILSSLEDSLIEARKQIDCCTPDLSCEISRRCVKLEELVPGSGVNLTKVSGLVRFRRSGTPFVKNQTAALSTSTCRISAWAEVFSVSPVHCKNK